MLKKTLWQFHIQQPVIILSIWNAFHSCLIDCQLQSEKHALPRGKKSLIFLFISSVSQQRLKQQTFVIYSRNSKPSTGNRVKKLVPDFQKILPIFMLNLSKLKPDSFSEIWSLKVSDQRSLQGWFHMTLLFSGRFHFFFLKKCNCSRAINYNYTNSFKCI